MEKSPNNKGITNNPTKNQLSQSKKGALSSPDIRKTRTINPYLQAEIDKSSIKSLPQDGAWIPRFLAALRKGSPAVVAARTAQISRSAAYEYAQNHSEMAVEWRKAEKDGIEFMEDVLKRRAETTSDYALLAYLKARDERYREKVHFEIVKKYIGDYAVRVTQILKTAVPGVCPHCKTNLELPHKIADALRELSAEIGAKD